MRRKKESKEKPCKNCGAMPNEHNSGQYDDLMCEMERLPLQIQEAYLKAPRDWEHDMRPYIIYYPMDNLQYLEYEYERTQRDTPTRKSLR